MATTMINWTVTKAEGAAIAKIVERAFGLAARTQEGARLQLTMDITAAHANGCPLDLGRLLAAAPFDFAHDIAGIQRHLDRSTGTLTDCFLPRYAK